MVGMRTCTATTLPPWFERSPIREKSALPGALADGRIPLGECFEGGPDRVGHVHCPGDRVEGLQPVAGVDDHRLGVRVEQAVLEQLAQHAEGDAAGGLAED